jgi:hypothetical protein
MIAIDTNLIVPLPNAGTGSLARCCNDEVGQRAPFDLGGALQHCVHIGRHRAQKGPQPTAGQQYLRGIDDAMARPLGQLVARPVQDMVTAVAQRYVNSSETLRTVGKPPKAPSALATLTGVKS